MWEAYARAKKLLVEYREVLDRVAQSLMKLETLDGEELQRLLTPTSPPASQAQPELAAAS